MASAVSESKKRRLSESLPTINTRVKSFRPLLPPACLAEELPVSDKVKGVVNTARDAIGDILEGRDDRIVVVVGPCSIHDPVAAMDYARKLKALSDTIASDVLVVMRVYFEKPRTTVGWKGLINDPSLDGSFNINQGLRIARKLLIDINELGLPVGCEFLDSISPQFIGELVSWGAIGARTTESQIHRELASGLSCAIGFKNGTGGNVQVAIDAITSASNPHSFLGVTDQGLAAIVNTSGNPYAHLILRGGSDGPNYSAEHIALLEQKLAKSKKPDVKVVVDCSHANSKKIHTNQPLVSADVAGQIAAGNRTIAGLMIESNINAGNQKLSPGTTVVADLKYGVSVTDACVDFEVTTTMLHELAKSTQARRAQK